jgi:hypothetical protein
MQKKYKTGQNKTSCRGKDRKAWNMSKLWITGKDDQPVLRSIRTDLALEAREMAQEQNQFQIPGVKVEEVELKDIKVTRVEVLSKLGEDNIGKPKGNYITLEVPGVKDRNPEYESRWRPRPSPRPPTAVRAR